MTEIYSPTNVTTPAQDESAATGGFTLRLNPWTVQNICFELIANHMIGNDPKALGYAFDQRYDPDTEKTGIFLGVANVWDPKQVSQRPAIFVSRSDVQMIPSTFQKTIGQLVRESEKEKLTVNAMTTFVSCIAPTVGLVEQLADYVKHPFIYFQEQIQKDFRMRRFRLEGISKPQIYVEGRDNFVIMLNIATIFDECWIIKGEDLKIKTISKTIFDRLTGNRIAAQ